jgi:hypothetical protein
MAKFNKPTGPISSGINEIPVQEYVLKITKVDGSPSKSSGNAMFAVETTILCTKTKEDVVTLANGASFVVGGRSVRTVYWSMSDRAVDRTMSTLRTIGVTEEALDALEDTEDKDWQDANLVDKCFTAILANEVSYRASNGKSYTVEGLADWNKKNPNSPVAFVEVDGHKHATGVRYVISDITGAATPDGNPF